MRYMLRKLKLLIHHSFNSFKYLLFNIHAELKFRQDPGILAYQKFLWIRRTLFYFKAGYKLGTSSINSLVFFSPVKSQ